MAKKIRHKCYSCGAKKYAKFLNKVNDWHQGQWRCRNTIKCAARGANYRK